MTDTNKLTEARIEIARLEAEVEFQKRMKDACVDVIRDQVKKSTPAMAESPADRRERIAEALFVMLMGHCAAGNMLWSADLCAEQSRVWADAFVAGATEQPQPKPPIG